MLAREPRDPAGASALRAPRELTHRRAIIDGPDDEGAEAAAITINSSGAVSVRTTRLLTVEQVDEALRRTVNHRPSGT